ncbi:MAG: hypothetical protein HY434_01675 [Candidatus Liptonbacteria bacterium]|nr:hypothetical protein [Candidatus Liptonbacteria bacterium]
MSKVEIKRVANVRGGECDLVDLSKEQQRRIPYYIGALVSARRSEVAKPIFSNYFCKESIALVGHSSAMPAGNIEYGCNQALHGEESTVAALRSVHGRNPSPVILGIHAGSEVGMPANPCGNCRDIMLGDLNWDSEIVHGNPQGGVVVVAGLRDYFFDAFRPASGPITSRVHKDVKDIVESARRFENNAYAENVPANRRYFVMIQTKRGNRFFGAHDVPCDYHPVYAGRIAMLQARWARDAEIAFVAVVYQKKTGAILEPPHVMYKDRQHLMELNYEGEIVSGTRNDPPVHLVACDGNLDVVGAWETTLEAWLPLPFTPRNFMNPDAMEKYYKGLRGL